jgi:D-sedoheptulose 7-phosphate isomerase
MNSATLAAAADRFCTLLGSVECSAGLTPLAADAAIDSTLGMLQAVRQRGGSVFVIGNGGSAAVAAHIQNDLVNKGRLRAQVLHEPSLMTCMSNDYGYDAAFSRLVGFYAREGDLLIAISSSGRSPNILAAVEAARSAGASVVSLSGFGGDNPLRTLGDVNFWSPSPDYGEVEISHLFLLHYIADCLADRP